MPAIREARTFCQRNIFSAHICILSSVSEYSSLSLYFWSLPPLIVYTSHIFGLELRVQLFFFTVLQFLFRFLTIVTFLESDITYTFPRAMNIE